MRLREKAVKIRFGTIYQRPLANHSKTGESENETDELDVFGGRTMLVTSLKSVLDIPLSSGVTPAPSRGPRFTKNLLPGVGQPSHEGTVRVAEGAVWLPQDWGSVCTGPSHDVSYGTSSGYQYTHQHDQENVVLADRWSSFIHDPCMPILSDHPPRQYL